MSRLGYRLWQCDRRFAAWLNEREEMTRAERLREDVVAAVATAIPVLILSLRGVLY